MSTVANIYDNGPISPIARIKENLSIWTSGNWSHYKIAYIEPMPRSSPLIAELVTLSGNTTIPANGTIAAQLLAILQLAELNFLHLRFEPLDDMEGILWEQASQGRFVTRGAQARVNMFTAIRDPWLASSTFWIIGMNRDMSLEARNPAGVARPRARFAFWGYRYILEKLTTEPGQTTWVPAEGRP